MSTEVPISGLTGTYLNKCIQNMYLNFWNLLQSAQNGFLLVKIDNNNLSYSKTSKRSPIYKPGVFTGPDKDIHFFGMQLNPPSRRFHVSRPKNDPFDSTNTTFLFTSGCNMAYVSKNITHQG